MADFCLSCCSTVDLDLERMKQRDLRYVCFHYMLDGAETKVVDSLGATSEWIEQNRKAVITP